MPAKKIKHEKKAGAIYRFEVNDEKKHAHEMLRLAKAMKKRVVLLVRDIHNPLNVIRKVVHE